MRILKTCKDATFPRPRRVRLLKYRQLFPLSFGLSRYILWGCQPLPFSKTMLLAWTAMPYTSCLNDAYRVSQNKTEFKCWIFNRVEFISNHKRCVLGYMMLVKLSLTFIFLTAKYVECFCCPPPPYLPIRYTLKFRYYFKALIIIKWILKIALFLEYLYTGKLSLFSKLNK